jgi:hypothetical protein
MYVTDPAKLDLALSLGSAVAGGAGAGQGTTKTGSTTGGAK